MSSVYLEFSNCEPQYRCTDCGNCSSLFGKSLTNIKNRGCCWYYPKFTLYEIHKMTKSKEGLDTLRYILNNSNTIVYNYYIHAKGYFDEKGYNSYINSNGNCNLNFASKSEIEYINNSLLNEERKEFRFEEFEEYHTRPVKNLIKPRVIHDKSMFFRTCPFVKDKVGCTINPKFRSFICNLFVCDEIEEKIKKNDYYKMYIKERKNYIRWIDWENTSLQMYLENKHLNLIDNLEEVINILIDIKLEEYEFPRLKEIKYYKEDKVYI